MATATLVWPRSSRKTAGANFMSPAKHLDPDRLTLCRLNELVRLQADLTLALANPRTTGRRRICQQIIELDQKIGRWRAALAAAGWRP
jgi:hypothetical protein